MSVDREGPSIAQRYRENRLQRRLNVEEDQLNTHFPSLAMQYRYVPERRALIGAVRSNSKKKYMLRIQLGNFPDEAPLVYVSQPVLRTYDGTLLSRLKGTESFHTLAPDETGGVQICHYNDQYWRPSITLLQVLIKTRLWLEAYEAHLRTGESIDTFLAHM